MDVLLDKKLNAWLMEVNANPSLNMYLEKDLPPGSTEEPEKVLSELDKFVKTKVVAEAIRIVTGEGSGEYEGTFEQILPHEDATEDYDEYYIWNRALELFELIVATGKKGDENITLFQFSRLARVPEFLKINQFLKADLDICFKNMQRKYDSQTLDIHAFFDAIEILSKKIWKEESFDCALSYFLDAALPYYEQQVENKQAQF